MEHHFYFDEGGMIGNPIISITGAKLKHSKREHHISNYYFGKLSMNNKWITENFNPPTRK
jgi:hypothetical protein